MLHRSRPLTIVLILVGLTALVAVAIIIGTQYQRATRAESRAATAEDQASRTKAELFTAEQTLSATQDELDSVEADIDDMSASVHQAAATNDRYAQRDADCRAVVKVSDELLSTAVIYGKADHHMLRGRDGHDSDLIDRVPDHTDKIDAVVKDAGYTTISELYNACTPGVLDYHGPKG
jgi:hypothetical protein